jgi:hypothetical protein
LILRSSFQLFMDHSPICRREWRADAGDDVFALGVDEEFAVKLVLTGARITRERDAGRRCRRPCCRRPSTGR